MVGGRTTGSESGLGQCGSGSSTAAAATTAATTAAPSCAAILCADDCRGSCGWSRGQEACLFGGRTTGSEGGLGVCA